MGASVARASEARESMIKLTQRSWIDFKGDSLRIHDPIKAEIKAQTLTVN